MHNILIISPHIDDAMLSLGGFIGSGCKKYSFTVLNVFSRSCFTNFGESNAKYVSWRRAKEDRLAFGGTGVRLEYLGLEDAFTRRSASIPDTLIANLQLFCDEHKFDTVLAPSGIGRDPDHVFLSTIFSNFHAKAKVLFYLDQPYASGVGVCDIPATRDIVSGLPYSAKFKRQRLEMYRTQITKSTIAEVLSFDSRFGHEVLLRHVAI